MLKKKLLPFWLIPASWGLVGDSRRIAQAEYELDGYELETAINTIRHSYDPRSLRVHQLITDKKYQKISDFDYDVAMVEHDATNETDKKLCLNELNKKYKLIESNEYEKTKATLLGEPWVAVVNFGVDSKNPSQMGEIELDWNEHFVTELKKHGYQGASDNLIVDSWFSVVCSTVALETGLVQNTPRRQQQPPTPPNDPLSDPSKREYK